MNDLSLYRPNVGVVLFNAEGRVWLGRRLGAPGPYNWQFPQGGVDDGEDLLDAAQRELAEETGVVSTRFLARTEDWIVYDFPPEYAGSKAARGWKGQRQVWFALRFEGEESEVRLDHHHEIEFDAWRWADLFEAADLVAPFKRPAYEQVTAAFASYATGTD
jgi:putative (di)nucleoside polyphosphate hydrolase